MFDKIYLLMINKKKNEEFKWDLEIKLIWYIRKVMTSMKLEELKAWIGLQLVPGVGNITLRRLIEHFGSAKAVWEAGPADFSEIVRLPAQVLGRLVKRS